LVQFQVQKLQCQQALQALRQAYLAQPNLVDSNNPIFQQYNTIIDGLNVKIAGEAQNLELNQQLLTLMLAQRLQPGEQQHQLGSLLNMHDLINSQSSQPQQPRGQLRIDQMFSSVPNRSTLSGTGNPNNSTYPTVQPKEEPRQ